MMMMMMMMMTTASFDARSMSFASASVNGRDDIATLFDAHSAFRAHSHDSPDARVGARARRDDDARATNARARDFERQRERRTHERESEDEGDDAREGDRDVRSGRRRGREETRERGAREASARDGPRDRSEDVALATLRRTVFVGNVPVSVKGKKLRAAFGKYGAVESVRLRNVPVEADGSEPRKVKVLQKRLNAERGNATAFVVFKDAASAVEAAREMNMKTFEGRHVRVDLASNPSIVKSEVVYDQNRSVFLGQLPFNVDDEDIIRLFNKNAEYPDLRKSVEAVRIVRDRKTTLGKGIGFVLFKTKEQARTALLLDGSKIGDREIRVSKASRAKAPKPGEASKARGEPKTATGAERRNPKLKDDAVTPLATGVRVANPWEGSRSRPGGKTQKTAFRGGDARPTPGGVGKPSMKKVGAKERTGKRPAVAARKAKMKAKAAASGGGNRRE